MFQALQRERGQLANQGFAGFKDDEMEFQALTRVRGLGAR